MRILTNPHCLAVPDGTEVICRGCYRENDIERVFIPKSVREIQEDAFKDCTNLREVIVEEGSALRTVGKSVFCNCKNLENITLPEGLERIEYQCFQNSGLSGVVIPNSVTTLESSAFQDCKSLSSVTFQEGSRLQSVASYCFSGSGLEEFVAPLSLRKIGGRAFCCCYSLKRVVLNEGLEKLTNCYDNYRRDLFGTF